MNPSIAKFEGDQLADVASMEKGDAVLVSGLVKRFGRKSALNDLDMRAPRGSVYALLGRNGAGKSTLIQILLGMLDATSGRIEVLGLDPLRNSVAIKQKIGYIPDRLPMYDWMTVAELLKFVASFYSGWSGEIERSLMARFRLERAVKVGALSRGFRALLSLVIAMAHNPDLVLLDECTSGMDAIARREFERTVIDTLQESGKTVLFAGHQIDEMERICDWVGILQSGRMLLEMPLEMLKQSVVLLRVDAATEFPDAAPGCAVLARRSSGRDQLVTVRLATPTSLPAAGAADSILDDPAEPRRDFRRAVGTGGSDMRMLIWKEWRENWPIVLWSAVLMLVLLIGYIAYCFANQVPRQWSWNFDAFLLFVWGISALLCGSSMVAPEIGSGTLQFLTSIPVSRKRIWWTKLLMSAVLLFLCLCASGAIDLLVVWIGPAIGGIDLSQRVQMMQSFSDVAVAAVCTLPLLVVGALVTMLVDRTISALMASIVVATAAGALIVLAVAKMFPYPYTEVALVVLAAFVFLRACVTNIK